MSIMKRVKRVKRGYDTARENRRVAKERRDVEKAERLKIRLQREVDIMKAKEKAAEQKLKLERVEARRAVERAKLKRGGKLGRVASAMGSLADYASKTNIGKGAWGDESKPKRKPKRRKAVKKSSWAES